MTLGIQCVIYPQRQGRASSSETTVNKTTVKCLLRATQTVNVKPGFPSKSSAQEPLPTALHRERHAQRRGPQAPRRVCSAPPTGRAAGACPVDVPHGPAPRTPGLPPPDSCAQRSADSRAGIGATSSPRYLDQPAGSWAQTRSPGPAFPSRPPAPWGGGALLGVLTGAAKRGSGTHWFSFPSADTHWVTRASS